ncbi:hypothetical protein DRW48_06880 [Paracoccus suum]|uniref:Flagellar motor switch protein FliN-like C-terminal domain-containing protein n=1 Tax=Paracoccus suum TaxID=2259340 RepID=A0A344PJ91_9RHOB|nr:FliM/FliN family flagellar motor C-terminal domain-containing protein [Paracoccus suum]AXC49446.1 hypothetical protein DRW48_06880 [Paracoccus suum]
MDASADTAQPADTAMPEGRKADAAHGRVGGVLRARLIAAGVLPGAVVQPAPLAPALPPSLERVVALASGRAAARASGLQASAETVTVRSITLAELSELLPEGALIAVIEGPAERLGVIALCPAMIASLIEMQAIGRISARAAAPRRATRTDAAIAADFVNALLAELGASLASRPLGEALCDFRYASYLDDPRPLALMLEDGGFHALDITLRLGAGGERTGQIFLAVPGAPIVENARVADNAPALSPPAGSGAVSLPTPRQNLASAVAQAPVPLAAILCRRSITLRELRALRPGAILNLPRAALDAVQIETATGQALSSGRLGEADGFYAVRLRSDSVAAGAIGALPDAAAVGASAGSGVSADPSDAFDAVAFGSFTADVTLQATAPQVNHSISSEPPIADLGTPDTFRLDPSPPSGLGEVVPLPMSFPGK